MVLIGEKVRLYALKEAILHFGQVQLDTNVKIKLIKFVMQDWLHKFVLKKMMNAQFFLLR